MGPLTFVGLLAVAGFLAWRYYGPRPAPRREPPPPLRPTRLEQDPKTGVYRPVERDDTRR